MRFIPRPDRLWQRERVHPTYCFDSISISVSEREKKYFARFIIINMWYYLSHQEFSVSNIDYDINR